MSLTDLLVSESNGFRDGVVRRLCFTSGLPHGPQSRERGAGGGPYPLLASPFSYSGRKDRPMQLRFDSPLQRFERQCTAGMIEQ